MALEVTLHDGDNGNYEIELKGQGSAGNDFGSGQDLVWSKVDDDQVRDTSSFHHDHLSAIVIWKVVITGFHRDDLSVINQYCPLLRLMAFCLSVRCT